MNYVRWLWPASLRNSWPLYLIVIVIFGVGLVMGALGVNTLHEDQTTDLHQQLQIFIAQAAELTIDQAQMARGSLYHNFVVGVIIYILGLTIVCLPLMLAFIFFRGFILGFTIGFLTMDRELYGLLIIAVSILPHNIIFIPAIIIGGTASLSFSILLIKRFFNSQTRVWPAFLSYNFIMAGVMVSFVLAALVEAYISPELTRFSASLFAGW